MENYTLFEEYTTLGKLLKELGLISTGGQAKIFLAEHEGKIFYNGEAENRRGKKLYAGDELAIPEFDLLVKFTKATPEALAEREAEKAEEERVKAIVKSLNAENKKAKPKKQGAPRFPGRR